jgi:hypothetical protein
MDSMNSNRASIGSDDADPISNENVITGVEEMMVDRDGPSQLSQDSASSRTMDLDAERDDDPLIFSPDRTRERGEGAAAAGAVNVQPLAPPSYEEPEGQQEMEQRSGISPFMSAPSSRAANQSGKASTSHGALGLDDDVPEN